LVRDGRSPVILLAVNDRQIIVAAEITTAPARAVIG
jgi:hypothetical protein